MLVDPSLWSVWHTSVVLHCACAGQHESKSVNKWKHPKWQACGLECPNLVYQVLSSPHNWDTVIASCIWNVLVSMVEHSCIMLESDLSSRMSVQEFHIILE